MAGKGSALASTMVSAEGLFEVGDGMLVVFLGTVVVVVLGAVFVMTSPYRIDLVTYWLKLWKRQPGDPMPRPPKRSAKPPRRGRKGAAT